MLQSMTGFGEAHTQHDHLAVTVEVRTINNRFFKLSVRASEGYGSLESLVENEVRRAVHRGTIQVNLRVDRRHTPDDYRLNVDVLERYQQQLLALLGKNKMAPSQSAPRIESLLPLPGVVEDASSQSVDAMNDWPLICGTLQSALEKLGQMRVEEGRAMTVDLAANCRAAAASLEQIERRAPLVVEEYRNRLFERLKRTLAELNVSLDPAAVIREVSLFADRSDISEEIVRLRSHLEQFQATMESDDSAGRKLDFLTQEMFRETNTIGSKANDVEITRCVIEIKTVVERIREMIQNIE
ncbi:MAG: YicC family protein [Planctomycetaceae bacterium]|nr:YicC family protein [Planctomycetaceae bacterium]